MTLKAFDAAGVVELFVSWRNLFVEQREFLIALDGKVGDSDLGITMAKSFAAAAETVLAEGDSSDISRLLRSAGIAIARAAPSTMGTLTATGFLRASNAVEGRKILDTVALSDFWKAYRDGVAERGKAKVGDKTLLDVLDPIATTMRTQASMAAAVPTALYAAAEAGATALEATKSMVAQHGKAAAFQQKTVGHQDAGATVGYFMIRRMAELVVVD